MMSLLMGSIGKRKVRIYLLAVAILFFSSLLISELFFPGDYSARSNYISDHGSLEMNPDGAIFFIIGVGITGALLIPYFVFIFRRSWRRSKVLSIIALTGGIAGSIGLSMVGLFPKGSNLDNVHDIGSALAWYGFLLSMVTTSGIFGIALIQSKNRSKLVGFILFGMVLFISGVQVFLLRIPTLRQWMAFATIFLWLAGIHLFLPDRFQGKMPQGINRSV